MSIRGPADRPAPDPPVCAEHPPDTGARQTGRMVDAATAEEDQERTRELSILLDRWDPIGVYTDPGDDCPAGEYACMVGPLMSMLERGSPAPDIAAWVRRELTEHFGLTVTLGAAELAVDLRTWWDARRPRQDSNLRPAD